MALLPVLAFRNQLPQIVVDELEQLVASINVVLETQIGDTSDLQAVIDHLQDLIDEINATRTHNLLSTRHPDTIPNDPQPGAIVVGTPQDIDTDMSPYWMDGLPMDLIPVALDPGGAAYWMDGLPMDGFLGGSLADTKWERSTPTEVDTVPVFDGAGIEWRAFNAGSAERVSAYISAFGQVVANNAQTLMSFSATDDDSAGFWDIDDPTKFIVPTGKGGTYQITGQLTWDASIGSFNARILVNGVQKAQNNRVDQIGEIDGALQVTTRVVLNEGDYVQLAAHWAYSPDPTNRVVNGGQNVTFLQMVKA